MRVLFWGIGGHLPGLRYPSGPASSIEPWFWVVHPEGTPNDFFTDEETREVSKVCLKSGGAILFLSGHPFGGLTGESDAAKFEETFGEVLGLDDNLPGRVHCLRVSCSGDSPKIVERIRRFLITIEGSDPFEPITWSDAEPSGWPESIVALYVVLKALETSKENENRIRHAWNELDPTWRKRLWDDAWAEYQEAGDLDRSLWLDAHLPTSERTRIDLPDPNEVVKAVEILKLVLSGKP